MSPFHPSQDDWVDHELGDVALPEGMLHRLHGIARYCDEAIDAELTNVRPPAGFLQRLLTISQPAERHGSGRQLAVAASLMIAVGMSYLGSLGFYLAAAYQHRPDAIAALDSRLSGTPIESDRATVVAVSQPVAVEHVPLDDVFSPPEAAPTIELASMPGDPPVTSPAVPVDLPGIDELTPATSLLVSDRFSEQVLGGMQVEEESPELYRMPSLAPRGVKHPDVEGFDYAFQTNHGAHPVVELKFPRLRQSVIPLDATAESYHLVKQYVAEKELPSPDVVRTEEFLAAMQYGLPLPARGKLALHVAAAPSPLGKAPGLYMLQIGLQAGDVPAQSRKGARHLIVLVDVSRSMQRGGRLVSIQSALQSLVNRLGKHDRLSLVSFSGSAQVLIEDAGKDHADSLQKAIDALRVDSGANVAAGLQAANRVATEWAWVRGRDQRVVLLTDGLYELDAASSDLIGQWIANPDDHPATLSVIDAALDPKPPKLKFATQQTKTVNDFGWQLVEELTGQSQLIALQTKLSIRFSNGSVHSYRLLGHEETSSSKSPTADLYAGETNVALYELHLMPKPEDEIAEITLEYKDPKTNATQQVKRKVRRKDFFKDFEAAPAPFQLGLLAAETAELLRNSYFRPGFRYETLQGLASQTSPAVQSSESFQDLMTLVQAALHAHRSPTPRP